MVDHAKDGILLSIRIKVQPRYSHEVMFSSVKIKFAGLVFFLLPEERQVFLAKK